MKFLDHLVKTVIPEESLIKGANPTRKQHLSEYRRAGIKANLVALIGVLAFDATDGSISDIKEFSTIAEFIFASRVGFHFIGFIRNRK